MNTEELDDLQRWMCHEARAMDCPLDIQSPISRDWWSSAFPVDEQEDMLLDASARAFAHERPLPTLSAQQRAKLAFRLRLGSRIARTIGRRGYKQLSGWFPERLVSMTRTELLEWILVDAWPFVAEVFDESLWWFDEQPDIANMLPQDNPSPSFSSN